MGGRLVQRELCTQQAQLDLYLQMSTVEISMATMSSNKRFTNLAELFFKKTTNLAEQISKYCEYLGNYCAEENDQSYESLVFYSCPRCPQ